MPKRFLSEEDNMTTIFKTTDNFDEVIKDFTKMRQEFKKEIINEGMTKQLNESLVSLKKELKYIFTDKIKAKPVNPKKPLESNQLIQESISESKSKETILKHLTGVDVKEFNNQKDKADYYNQTSGPKLINSQRSKGSSSASRVTLRIPINEGDTVKSQFQAAKQFFKEALFSFPDNQGGNEFVVNNLPDLEDHLKIKCSSYTGDDDFEDFGGMSPERRFETDAKNKGFAEWTLKQAYVDKIQKTGVSVSRVVASVLSGDYDEAKNYLGSIKNPEIKKLIPKVSELENNKNLTPETAATNNIAQLISNLKIKKTISEKRIVYKLVSSSGEVEDKDFMFELERQVSLWKNINIDKWLAELKARINVVINNFYK